MSSPTHISKLAPPKFIRGVMDKVVAVELEILFIGKDLREGLPSNDADARKAALSFTHLPNEFPPNKAAAILATNHENKYMMLVLVLVLLPVAVLPTKKRRPCFK
jgi:hypothetical protein